MNEREAIFRTIVNGWVESGNQPVVVETVDCIVNEIIKAGFISCKESSDMARETCDILRRIKNEEIYRITKEREDLAHRLKIADLALAAMSETMFTADGGCAEICPVWDNECIRLASAVFCKEAKRSDRVAHCVERWKQHALEEFLKSTEE